MKSLFLIITVALFPICLPYDPPVIEEVRVVSHSEGDLGSSLRNKSTLPSPVATDKDTDIDTDKDEIEKKICELWKDRCEEAKVASTDWDRFIEKARPIAAKYDIPLKVMVSQAALETGHGTSWQARVKNNYFGLGAYNDNTSFGYSSVEESIEYYAKLIAKNKRYSKAYEARHDPLQMIREIKKSGYASDPAYVEKVTSLAVWNNY